MSYSSQADKIAMQYGWIQPNKKTEQEADRSKIAQDLSKATQQRKKQQQTKSEPDTSMAGFRQLEAKQVADIAQKAKQYSQKNPNFLNPYIPEEAAQLQERKGAVYSAPSAEDSAIKSFGKRLQNQQYATRFLDELPEQSQKITTGSNLADAAADLIGFGAGLVGPGEGAGGVVTGGASPIFKAADRALPSSLKTLDNTLIGRTAHRVIHGGTTGVAYGTAEGITQGKDAKGIAKKAGEEALMFAIAEPAFGVVGEGAGMAIRDIGKYGGQALSESKPGELLNWRDAANMQMESNKIPAGITRTLTEELEDMPSEKNFNPAEVNVQRKYSGDDLDPNKIKPAAEEPYVEDLFDEAPAKPEYAEWFNQEAFNKNREQQADTVKDFYTGSKQQIPFKAVEQPEQYYAVDRFGEYSVVPKKIVPGDTLNNGRVMADALLNNLNKQKALPAGVNWAESGRFQATPDGKIMDIKEGSFPLAKVKGVDYAPNKGIGTRQRIAQDIDQPVPRSDIGDPAYLKELEGKYNGLVNAEVANLKKEGGQGVQQGGLAFDQEGNVINRFGRTSNNPQWYRDFYANNGRAPNAGDYREIAIKNLIKGNPETGEPANQEFLSTLSELSRGQKLPEEWHGLQQSVRELEGVKAGQDIPVTTESVKVGDTVYNQAGEPLKVLSIVNKNTMRVMDPNGNRAPIKFSEVRAENKEIDPLVTDMKTEQAKVEPYGLTRDMNRLNEVENAFRNKTGMKDQADYGQYEGVKFKADINPDHDLKILRDAFDKRKFGIFGGKTKVDLAPEAMDRPEFQAAGAIADKLGLRMVPYKGNGARGAQNGRTIYVNEKIDDPIDYIFWHEVGHSMKDTHLDHYSDLLKIAADHIENGPGINKHYKKQGYKDIEVPDEFAADIFAESLSTPGFFARVAEQSPELLKPLFEAINKMVEHVRGLISKDDSLAPYMKDLEGLRERIKQEVAMPYFKDAMGEKQFVETFGKEWAEPAAKVNSIASQEGTAAKWGISANQDENKVLKNFATAQRTYTPETEEYKQAKDVIEKLKQYAKLALKDKGTRNARKFIQKELGLLVKNKGSGYNYGDIGGHYITIANGSEEKYIWHEVAHNLLVTKGGSHSWLEGSGVKGEWEKLQNSNLWYARADSGGHTKKYGDSWAYGTMQTERYARLFEVYMMRNEQLKKVSPKLYDKVEALLDDIVPQVAMLRDSQDFVYRHNHGDIYNFDMIGDFLKGKESVRLPKRYANYGVGKDIGGKVYLHKDYEENLPQGILNAAKKELPDDFEYTAVAFDRKNGDITFTYSPDFNSSPEPIVGDQYLIKADGTVRFMSQKNNPQIWHHKWMWVKDDYNGFDVAESMERSKEWLSIPGVDKSRIGYKEYWEQNVVPLIKPADQQLRQAISSANTSLSQVAATFKSKYFEPGGLNIDVGGGKYDKGTQYLKDSHGTENLVYDPFNRNGVHNQEILKRLQSGERGDTVTVNNVLNVIAEPDVRLNVVKQAAKALDPDGKAYFQIYEGTGDGIGRETTKGWQNNSKAGSYVDEISNHFKETERHGSLIIASKPYNIDAQAVWGLDDVSSIRFKMGQERSRMDELHDMVLAAAKQIPKSAGFSENFKEQIIKQFPQVADEAKVEDILRYVYDRGGELRNNGQTVLRSKDGNVTISKAELQAGGNGASSTAAQTRQTAARTAAESTREVDEISKQIAALKRHIENAKKATKYDGNEIARTARVNELQTELNNLYRQSRNKEGIRDISGFQAETQDIARNLRDFYGKDVELEEGSILDQLNEAKGRNINYQEQWANKLKTDIVDKLGIKKNSPLSKLVQQYGEGEITLEQLKAMRPKTWQNVVEADKWFRQAYDKILNDVNNVIEQIYPGQADKLVPKRKDYYRHFRDLEGFEGFQNMLGSPANISPELAGRSQFVKPNTKWASFKQQRGLGEFKRDAVGGFLDYLPAASYSVHIDPSIKQFRQLSDQLASETAGEANTMIRYLQEFANSLAGKTSGWDRKVQEFLEGRGGSRVTMNVISWLNNRAKANSVMLNPGSALSQVLNIPNGVAFAKQHSIPGTGRAILGMFKEDTARASSAFMKERYAGKTYRQFDTRLIDQPKNFAAWLLETSDRLGTEMIWHSCYSKGLNTKGVTNPVKYADAMTKRLVAGRGIGEMALIQQSKLFQIAAPFQVEVGNLWKIQRDFMREKDFGGLILLYAGLWLANNLMEEARGQRIAFDPINAIYEAVQEITDPKNNATEKAYKSVGRLGGEILSNIPGGQTLAAMYPEYGDNTKGLPTRKELFGSEDPTRFGTGPLFVKALQDPLKYLAFPYGGAQADKMWKAGKALYNEGSYQNNQERGINKIIPTLRPSGDMRYPVEADAENTIKGMLFGTSAMDETKDYYNNNRRPLSEKQTIMVEKSSNPEATYKRLIKAREIKSIQAKMKDVSRDKNLTAKERREELKRLRSELREVQAGK